MPPKAPCTMHAANTCMYDISSIYIYYAPLAPRLRSTWNTYIPGSVPLPPSLHLPLIHLGDPDDPEPPAFKRAAVVSTEQPCVVNRRFHARARSCASGGARRRGSRRRQKWVINRPRAHMSMKPSTFGRDGKQNNFMHIAF